MKKLFIILISILTIFILSSCDITELSAPEAETTREETSTEPEETTKGEETTTQTDSSTTECEYCGELDGNRRWFIARVTDDLMIDPMGSECFEAKSAMGAGITLWYKEVDGDPDKKLKAGDVIKVEYNGLIMESYPVQISSDKVTTVNIADITPPKKLSDYLVSMGDIPVKSGTATIYPLKGYVWSEEHIYNEATGETMVACGDGMGVYSYLEAIFNGEISDEDMPVLILDGSIELKSSSQVRYIDFKNGEEEVSCSVDELSSLPDGQYYVIFSVDTKSGENRYGYDYIFKLVIKEPQAEIQDYIISDLDRNLIYLELPLSKHRVWIDDYEKGWLNFVDIDLLIEADKYMTGGYEYFDGDLYIGLDNENYLCLCSETIVDINPPDPNVGCFDHEHIFDQYRISKEPCY